MTKSKRAKGRARSKNWGGRRPGAGRKPKGEKAGVSHRTREALASRFPVLLTVRRKEELPSFRTVEAADAIRAAFAQGCDKFGFRLVHYSVHDNHMHLVVEAVDREALSRGMQGLMIRTAKALNRVWGRRGSVFADRYHDRILRTPKEVRNVLGYVLGHGGKQGRRPARGIDPFGSGRWFDGYRDKPATEVPEDIERPVADARTWLLTKGWRKHGLISLAPD